MMGIIKYFKRLKENFLKRRTLETESIERFYSQCKEGILSFFQPYLTKKGFYLELENKEGLIDYLSEKKSNKTIENILNKSNESISLDKGIQRRIYEYTKPISEALHRMVNYFEGISKKEIGKYDSLSFVYEPTMKGYETETYKNKLSFSFG